MLKIGIKGVTVCQFGVNEGRRDMRVYFYSCSATFLALISCAPQSAMAQVLTPFRYESQAQRHCPEDTIVWLDFGRARYYPKSQRRYASGYTGSFACRNEARDSGYRRSLLGLR